MKKVFTLLTLALLSIGTAWAQTTIGLTQTVTDDGSTHTVGSATYTGATNVTVAKSIGSSCNDGQKGKTVTVGSPEVSYSATEAFRKTVRGTDFVDAQYVGYTMTIASGYKVSLSNLNAEFWSSDATMYWKVVVANASGTALYTSSTVQNNSNNKGSIAVASPTGVSNLTAGTYTIKLMMYQNGGNKYFVVPSLTFSATVEEDTTPTYTITSSAGAGGTVSPSGDTDVIENGNLSVTATANTGYAFASWTIDGVANASTANPYTFSSVTADHTIAAVFDAMYSISFNVASENKGTSTVGPATQYANNENKWTAPQNYYTAKEGYTLTAWNDGENNYVPGTEYTLAGNITVAPVYTANTVGLEDFTTTTTVSWPLSANGGAPSLASEGNTQYYVQRATIAGNTVDIPIFVNTTDDYGISEKRGKFVSSATNCQVNAGTVFKIPAVKNMVVNYIFSSTTAVGNVGFTDDVSDLGGDGSALTAPSGISGDNKTITYTYTGTADYLYMVDKAGGKYPTGISVTYPGPAIGSHSMTWTLSPLNTTDKTLTSSQASTTENLTNLTTIDASKITFTSSASKAGDRTAKIDRTVNKDANTYVSLTFDVKDGCTFTPSAITIKVANVTNATTFDAELIDENDVTVSETGKSFASTDGTVETWTISNSDASKKMTGTVTLKIYAYAETAGSFRFGNSIAIAGDVAEFVAVSTLADRNYASYVPAKKLDFSAADGITAYIATGLNGGKTAISLTEVDVVAAGTPIIVKTDTKGATVNVPMTIADATDASENKLVAGDGTTSATADVDYVYYYLASDQFHKATSGTLQSGKAYLKIAAGDATAHDLTFDFGDMTTGINMVNGEGLKVQGSEVYNLNGQRVMNPTKGLYIVNGRKVVVK